jgi:ABC-type antimicrobial peptide transport system permease subunit
MIVLLSFLDGLRDSLEITADPGSWIVLGRETDSEVESYIDRAQYYVLRARPEIALDSSGNGLISPEMVVPFNAAIRRPATAFCPAYLRGVSQDAFKIHRRLRIVAGRLFSFGSEEMIMGRRQAERFPELTVGSTFRYGRRSWTIVGIFSEVGSAHESEFWADANVLQQDAGFENGFSSLHVVLKDPDAFATALRNDARITVDVMSEREFYSGQTAIVGKLRSLAVFVILIVAAGAGFGAMNTMYASVAHRKREIGVLRSLGFSPATVLGSFVAESVVLALAGGGAGIFLGILATAALEARSRLVSVGMVLFSCHLTWVSCVAALCLAIGIGVLGGALPASRAARVTIVESLREA